MASTAAPEVVLIYVQEAVAGAATLLQDFPVVGIACRIFLSFGQVVEMATSNKDDLADLQELCDMVIKGVLTRWEKKSSSDVDLDDGFGLLAKHIEKAMEIAKRCRGNAVRQFLLSRKISKDIAAVRKNVLGLCTANTLLLSASLHVSASSGRECCCCCCRLAVILYF